MQIILTEMVRAVVNRVNHETGDFFALEPSRPASSFVKIPIQPDECLTAGKSAGRREAVAWQAAVQMPGQEQILTGWLPVGQTTVIFHERECGDGWRILSKDTPARKPSLPAGSP